MPPTFDESYYKKVIHEIKEMQVMNMGQYAHGNQPIHRYDLPVQSNGGNEWQALYKNWLSHGALTSGGSLNFNLSAVANRQRGTEEAAYPFSVSDSANN